jgi:predicted O-linked N-acetylglucosamine transferase (SPINDLY family)
MTARIKSAVPDFIEIGGVGDAAAVELLRGRGIDIAVDLNGYTSLARPELLAARVAPVQVNYLGYPATMGASFMDYIVGDRFVTPADMFAHFAEKIVTLPNCYLATDDKRAIAAQMPDRAAAGLPAQGFVFCAFTSAYKIAPEIFAAWMRLLRGVEGSVLWLGATDKVARDNLLREAAGYGVATERIVFAQRVPSNEDHLARHGLADLFLDTLPYNGHSTAADALWAGLPVLTCLGASFPGRVGASLLHAAGLAELVTSSLAEYEALALHLASAPLRLADLRARVASQRANSALFDTRRFTRHIEKAYAEMHRRAASGLAPGHFSVAND